MNTTQSLNPFLSEHKAVSATQVEQSRAVAEVQSALLIAKANPRDEVKAMDKILNACARQLLAETSMYQYTRGGADVTGPSIRLAEAIAQGWGNLQYGVRELESSDGGSMVQAYAWDMENNVKSEKIFYVKHLRSSRSGTKTLDDPRDIYEVTANQGARRMRACILSVIPGDVVEAAVRQCELTLSANVDASPAAVKKMVAAFEKFGVTKEQIEAFIGRRLDAIQPAQIMRLTKVYTSLKDGMSEADSWFKPTAPNPISALRERAPVDRETGEILAPSKEENDA